MPAKLGQHFLTDETIVEEIVKAAQLSRADTVLEIGPGKGILTKLLAERAGTVIAIEKDGELHHKLKKKFKNADNIELTHGDIRDFDLNQLPVGYKVAANIPYYLTGQLIPMFLAADNKPQLLVLMVQKEVAERLTAAPGQSSILKLASEVFAEITKILDVPKDKFDPPPEVDSAVVVFKVRTKPLIEKEWQKAFFRLIKFGFSGKRKMLSNTLGAALRLDKQEIRNVLEELGLNPDARPQELGIKEWLNFFSRLQNQTHGQKGV